MSLHMNLEQARFNMVEQQVRPGMPLDADIRELLPLVRREDFVPAAWRHMAFADFAVPLGHGATMLTPRIEAAIVQALRPKKHERVLQIGTGSGYLSALLAVHADHVLGIEIEPELADMARANLHSAGIVNVTVETGDGFAVVLPDDEKFDVIVLTGGIGRLPAGLLTRLKIGGRLLGFVGQAPVHTAHLVTRIDDAGFQLRNLFETCLTPLRNAPTAKEPIL